MLQINAYKSNCKIEAVSDPKPDSLELSIGAQEMKLAKEMVLKSPDVRADKINGLKKQIQAGMYQVSSEEIASKMVERSLVDELARR
jgi:flagellar biosynthesis anti-sigma factor FlgM